MRPNVHSSNEMMTDACQPDCSVPRDHLYFPREAEHYMGMPASSITRRDWTLDEFYRERDNAPPGERWEYVDGEVLVTPSPRWVHQAAVTELLVRVNPYVKTHRLGRIFAAPLDVRLDARLVLQPDVLVVPPGQLRHESDIVRQLVLAVEILSPSSARHDRFRKRPAYQRNRVADYWIIDTESRMIERWTPDDTRPEQLSDVLQWHPAGATEPFILNLDEYFASIAVEE
jgi:Uma2 family endonuclease